MRKDLTQIVLIVDRSGSMAHIKNKAQSGVNEFITAQKNAEGRANILFVEFDSEIDTVANGDIKSVGEYKLYPRSMTALNDAIGTTFDRVSKKITKTRKIDRPGLVSVLIVTDGLENASEKFNTAQIKKLISDKQEEGWDINFMLAGTASFSNMGTYQTKASNTIQTNSSNVREAYLATSDKVLRNRRELISGKSMNLAYSREELTKAGDQK